MKSSTLLAILVLQALLVSAAVAKGGPKKPCCNECTSWSGVYTCDDLLTKCAATCKTCVPVSTDKGTRYRCRDFLPEGCPCSLQDQLIHPPWSMARARAPHTADGSIHAPPSALL